MEPTAARATYHTYLLRYWRVHSASADGSWRFMLIHPYTDARRTFVNLTALLHFLEEQLAVDEAGAATTTAPADHSPI
jgi:hypothetical protein